MRKHVITLLTFFLVTVVIAETSPAGSPDHLSKKVVYGKIIDKVSGEEIAGAEIQIGEKKVYSDLEGNFTAMIATDTKTSKIEAAVNFISYNEACVTIDLFSYSPLVIEIVSK